ncbi:helix-turn-helix transcriptional regulator [Enterococcus gallinarum]|uniref:helix-turn-helix domain-containing protein n=1 Tax=Enterococcus gallinarum TaxID=1353 RepID=UPI002090B6A8|nr:helix-turn-helix transcriptional regulator [Enterococcus gallinarum]MCO5475209.1 helix-turn-helix transcriptional regulator [Enterococcus gallinarum]
MPANSTVRIRLKELLDERNIKQKDLSIKSGIRESTISDICRGAKTVINFKHLARIADALEITEITELIELKPE